LQVHGLLCNSHAAATANRAKTFSVGQKNLLAIKCGSLNPRQTIAAYANKEGTHRHMTGSVRESSSILPATATPVSYIHCEDAGPSATMQLTSATGWNQQAEDCVVAATGKLQDQKDTIRMLSSHRDGCCAVWKGWCEVCIGTFCCCIMHATGVLGDAPPFVVFLDISHLLDACHDIAALTVNSGGQNYKRKKEL
jgi:hypothetical protein